MKLAMTGRQRRDEFYEQAAWHRDLAAQVTDPIKRSQHLMVVKVMTQRAEAIEAELRRDAAQRGVRYRA